MAIDLLNPGDRVDDVREALAEYIGLQSWTPVFQTVADGQRQLLQIADWAGGAGPKPAVGMYVGPAGYVTEMAAASDFRGRDFELSPEGLAASEAAIAAAANTAANLDGGPVFLTEAELLAYAPADRKPAILAVNSGSRRRGVYRRTAGAWPATPESDTLPSVDGRTALLETAVQPEAEVPGVLVAIEGPNGVGTFLTARDSDGAPTPEATQLIGRALLEQQIIPADADIEGAEDIGFAIGERDPVTNQLTGPVYPHSMLDKSGMFHPAVVPSIRERLGIGEDSTSLKIWPDETWRTKRHDRAPLHAALGRWCGWGSSTMAGYHTALTTLAAEFDAIFSGFGRGGCLNAQITGLVGTTPYQVTVPAGAIPGSGTTSIALDRGWAYSTMPTAWAGILRLAAGDVPVTLSGTDDAYLIQLTTPGASPVTTGPGWHDFIPLAYTENRADVGFLNAGKNNINDLYPLEECLRGNIELAEWHSPMFPRLLCLGHCPRQSDVPGGAGRVLMLQVRDAEMAYFGDRYIDLYTYVMGEQIWTDTGLTKTADDIADIAAGKIARQFCQDDLHLTGTARTAIVNHPIRDKILSLGWYGA
ncbi:hypothetical protein [Ancylobacter sp. G4_0304]|uniref:hypothetical protein n=1 Tax=Ancylobacter sp. G4_0304 TaxID=3114289 RepID=UPI0039C6EFB1